MNFREHQGIKVRRNYYYEDNESAMQLKKNGIQSASKQLRHIDIRFFLITDCIKRSDIHPLYCLTEDMLIVYFSKPLQGGLFKKFGDQIMGITPANPIPDPSLPESSAQERVGSKFLGPDGQQTDDVRRTDSEQMTDRKHMPITSQRTYNSRQTDNMT